MLYISPLAVHNPVAAIFPLPSHTHRLATDLLLWQPASPSTVEKANAKSMLFSCMDVLQPAATQEDRFQMCKSVLKEGKGEREYILISRTRSDCEICIKATIASSCTLILTVVHPCQGFVLILTCAFVHGCLCRGDVAQW